MEEAKRGEPELVGDARSNIVEDIREHLTQVVQLGEPRWVSITAPTGWGKTRLVREFYHRVADAQPAPSYWPADLLAQRPDGELSVDRKRVSDSFTHTPDSVPSYMWWGIRCAGTAHSPMAQLAAAIGELAAHSPYLENAWRIRASASERVSNAVIGLQRELIAEGSTEVAVALAEAAAGVEPVGLGLAWWAGDRVKTLMADRRLSSRLGASDDLIVASGRALVAEAVAIITRIGRVGLPLIIAIEDAHLIDEAMTLVLERLMIQQIPILIVATQQELQRDSNLFRAMSSRDDRVIEVRSRDAASDGLWPTTVVQDLTNLDREEIVAFRFPNVGPPGVSAISARYVNPLALELFCNLPRYKSLRDGDPTPPTQDEIDRAPQSVRGMYRQAWESLRPIERLALHVATSLSPRAIHAELGAERSWSTELVSQAVSAATIPYRSELLRAIVDPPKGWVRVEMDGSAAALEVDQYDVAVEDDDLLSSADLQNLYQSLVEATSQNIATLAAAPDATTEWIVCRTALALFARELPIDESAAGWAGLTVAAHLLQFRRSAVEARSVAAYLMRRLSDGPNLRSATIFTARADTVLGRTDIAEALLGSVLSELANLEDDVYDAREAMVVACDLATAQREGGHFAEAIKTLQLILPVASTLPAEQLQPYRNARLQLVMALVDGRYLVEAAAELNALIHETKDFAKVEQRWRWSLLGVQAEVFARAGQPERAIALWTQIAEELAARYGEDHPDVLLHRSNSAALLASISPWHAVQAVTIIEELVLARERAHEPNHPAVLTTRMHLADALQQSGQHRRARKEYLEVVRLSEQSLGPRHPHTLDRRSGAALSAADNCEFRTACAELAALIPDLEGVLGADHPFTVSAHQALAHVTAERDRRDGQI